MTLEEAMICLVELIPCVVPEFALKAQSTMSSIKK
jgi:hypothetical protein